MHGWVPDPPGLEELAPEAACRGCGAGLRRAAGGRWEDEHGILFCCWPDTASPVWHEPMPDGLRGAPVR